MIKKHKSVHALLLVCGLLFQAAQAQDIRIETLPDSAEAFVELRNELATTPEGGAAMLVVALLGFAESEALGQQFLTLALDQDNLMPGEVYKGYAPSRGIQSHIQRLQDNAALGYTGMAYVSGASADNNYSAKPPYTIVTTRNKYSGEEAAGRVKVFVKSQAASPRPVTMRKNDKGIWKAIECSSVFLSLPPPASATTPDEL